MLPHGYSPAQLGIGRKLRTKSVPCHPDKLKPETPNYDNVRGKEKEYRATMKFDYDRRHRVVGGEELSPGDCVWIPDLKAVGTIITQHEFPRSVVIQTSNGQVRRNRGTTRRVLEGNIQPHLRMGAMRVTKHHQRTREISPEGQEDFGELPVPEDQPAVNEPSQP